MNAKSISLAGAASLVMCGAASADFIGPDYIEYIDGGFTIIEVFAVFDSPTDLVLGVESTVDSPIRFFSWAPLVNSNPSDVFVGPVPGDSGVSIGNAAQLTPGWPSVSPTTPNGNGTVSGAEWEIPEGEGYFWPSGAPASLNQGVPGGVRLAYFSFDEEGTDFFNFSGVLRWRSGTQDEATPFVAGPLSPPPPAPGTLAALAVAGLVGGRRRRG